MPIGTCLPLLSAQVKKLTTYTETIKIVFQMLFSSEEWWLSWLEWCCWWPSPAPIGSKVFTRLFLTLSTWACGNIALTTFDTPTTSSQTFSMAVIMCSARSFMSLGSGYSQVRIDTRTVNNILVFNSASCDFWRHLCHTVNRLYL